MQSVDDFYAALVRGILETGDLVVTRNSACRRTIVEKIAFPSTPLISLRQTAWKNALREWEWFMSGSDNISDLHPSVRPWWAPWALPNGSVPKNYSTQFRKFAGGFDQIRYLLDGIREHPFSRRNLITTWNTADMTHHETTITNCHGTVIQAFGGPDETLHLVTYQRSADVICGLPHNWIQYWAFLLWLARRSNRQAGSLIWVGGDAHIYERHFPLAAKIIQTAKECTPSTPVLTYQPAGADFRADDFSLVGKYEPTLRERAEMVV